MPAEILIVDDDRLIRELVGMHLRTAGYRVRVAEDALVAGRLILRSTPDLMVVDVEMPHMNGLQLVAALRADRTVPQIPVIFLTSRADLEEQAHALGAGLLTKPCRADKLLTMVERCLAGAPRVPSASVHANLAAS